MSNFRVYTLNIIVLRVVKSRNITRMPNISRETIRVYKISTGEPERMGLL